MASDATAASTATPDTGHRSVVVTIQHPAHVHFFRHAIDELERRGHDVSVYAKDKDVAVDLLEAYDIDYEILSRRGPLYSLPARQAAYEYRLWRRVRNDPPDVMTAIGGVAVSHVASLVGAKSVVFTDTEHATLSNRVAFPFADAILTPQAYDDDHGAAQVRYDGCHELAYLHPDRYTPDRSVLDEIDLDPDRPYVVFRHGGWGALHDVGDGGLEDVVDVVERLESTGTQVVLTSEDDHPAAVADRAIDVPPERMHDVLAHASLFVGESGTMSLESAVLGTPAVYIHTARPGIVRRLAEYGLLFPFHGENRHREGVEKGVELLESDVDWERRRQAFVRDSEDPTTVVVSQLLGADQ